MSDPRKQIGARLAEARRERGLSQRFVAGELGVSRARIRAIEASGDIMISTLKRYGRAIGLSEADAGALIGEGIPTGEDGELLLEGAR